MVDRFESLVTQNSIVPATGLAPRLCTVGWVRGLLTKPRNSDRERKTKIATRLKDVRMPNEYATTGLPIAQWEQDQTARGRDKRTNGIQN